MKKHNSGDETSRIMEAYYGYIGEAHIDNIINELENQKEEIIKVEVPESLDEWVNDYVAKGKKDEKRRKLLISMKRFSKRAAIIILVFITVMSTIIFSVEAVRIRVLNFFIEKNEKYTEIRIDEKNSNNLTSELDWENYYSPSYMPKGYFFDSSKNLGNIKVLKYTDGENQIIFTQAKNGTDFQLDTEDAEIKEVVIAGNAGQFIIKGDKVILFWYNDEASFNIIGHVNREEIQMIAESVKKNKK